MRHLTRHALFVAAAAALFVPAPARSQSVGFLNVLGYATAGGALGIAATANAQCDGFVCIPTETVAATFGGVLAGVVAGVAINSSAQRKMDEGRPLGGAHLAALSIGTVLGGAVLGGAAAGAVVDRSGTGTFLGSDEQTIVLCMAVGAGLGVFRLHQHWHALTGRSVEVQPVVMHGGRPGVVASIHF